jgi:hypothetical protein
LSWGSNPLFGVADYAWNCSHSTSRFLPIHHIRSPKRRNPRPERRCSTLQSDHFAETQQFLTTACHQRGHNCWFERHDINRCHSDLENLFVGCR